MDRLNALLRFSERIVEVEDIDALLDQLLYETRNQCGADAGSIYLIEDDSLRFSYVQNDTLHNSRQYIYTDSLLPIDTSSIAGFTATTKKIINIDDAYSLPANVRYRFNADFDNNSGYKTKSIISAPLTKQSGELIGVLQLINKKESSGFIEDDQEYLHHVSTIASGAIERARISHSVLMRMLRMAELRDPAETGAHVNRVGSYAVEIYDAWANNNGISQQEIRTTRGPLRIAAMLHDIGKIAISDIILKKPDKLTEDEFSTIKTHTTIGAELFEEGTLKIDKMSYDIILGHHEHWNGDGYPRGVAGEKIPLIARIVALADVYDALISSRSYKEPWDDAEIIAHIKKESGKQFDPELVDVFLSIQDVIHNIRERYKE